jgi:hypothetical protein
MPSSARCAEISEVLDIIQREVEMNKVKPSIQLRLRFRTRVANRRRQLFTSTHGYKGDRLILGFYYYLHEDEIGDRSKGWRMFARDKVVE